MMAGHKFNPNYKPHAQALKMIQAAIPRVFTPTKEVEIMAGFNPKDETEYYYGWMALDYLAEHGIIVRKYTGNGIEWCGRAFTTYKGDARIHRERTSNKADKGYSITAMSDEKTLQLFKDVARAESTSVSAVMNDIIDRHRDELEHRRIPKKVQITMDRFDISRSEAESYLKELEAA